MGNFLTDFANNAKKKAVQFEQSFNAPRPAAPPPPAPAAPQFSPLAQQRIMARNPSGGAAQIAHGPVMPSTTPIPRFNPITAIPGAFKGAVGSLSAPVINTAQVPFSAGRVVAANLTHNQPALNNAHKALASDTGNNMLWNDAYRQTSNELAGAIRENPTLNHLVGHQTDLEKNHAANVKLGNTIAQAYGNSPRAQQYGSLVSSANDQNDISRTLANVGLTPTMSRTATGIRLGAPIVSAGAQTALNITGAGKGAAIAADVAAKQAAKLTAEQAAKKATGDLLKTSLKYGTTNAGISMLSPASQGSTNPMDYVKAGASGFAGGAAMPILGAGLTKGGAPILKAAGKLTNERIGAAKDNIALQSGITSQNRQLANEIASHQKQQASLPIGTDAGQRAHEVLQRKIDTKTAQIAQNEASRPQQNILQKATDRVLTAQPGMSMKAVTTDATPAEVLPHESVPQPAPEATGTGEVSSPNISTADHLQQQIAAQEAARKLGSPSGLDKFKAGTADIKAKMVDSLSPIEDRLNTKITADNATSHITPQLDRALRTDTIAGQYIKENGLAKVIQNVPNTKEFDQYLIAKHAADLEKNGIKTGRNAAADAQLVKDLGSKYEPHAQALKQYSNSLLDKAAEYGLISKDLPAQLKEKYPNYVPANRIFGENELVKPPKGTAGGKASLGQQSVVQKIKGSNRVIESPLSSIIDKTHAVIDQGERNLAAQKLISYKDLPGNPFNLTPLRTAERVTKRNEVRQYLSESKPLKQELEKTVSKHSQTIKKLSAQISTLQEKGQKALATNEKSMRDYAIKRANGDARLSGRGSNIARIPTDPQKFLEEYIASGKGGIRSLIERVSKKNSDVASLKNELDNYSHQLDKLKTDRKAAFQEGLANGDASFTNKNTISALNNGIKEVYQTDPAIAAAAKSLNKEQLGLVGKILNAPVRVLRMGATSLNPAFTGANIVKDLVTGAINSSHPLRSSVANPEVFVQALKASLNHGSKEYGELVREGAGGTSFDIARGEAVNNVKSIRAQKNAGTKIAYTVTHPAQLFRAAENAIGRSEEFSRALQYYGNKSAATASGASEQAARVMGAHAARNNTTNFARSGDFGKVLNSVIPYLNAGFQGSRTLVRNLGDRPAQTTAKLVVGAFMPVAAATAWNVSDPKRKAAYDDIKQYEKQGNIIIVPPNPVKDPNTGKWNVIKIPLSQEVANLGNSVRNGIEAGLHDGSFNAAGLVGDLLGTATSLNLGTPRQAIGQIIPQAIKVPIEAMQNKNLYTGNEIVPSSQKSLDPRDQYGATSSGTAKVIGNKLNISPRQIDNAVRTGVGGLGQNIINASDNALAKLGVIQPTDIKGTSFGSAAIKRFNGAQGSSQYDNIDTKSKSLVDQIKALPGYQSMNPADKAKALNRATNAVVTASTSKKALTPKQQAVVNGKVDPNSYLTASTGGSTIKVNTSISPHSQKVLNEYNTLDAATKKSKAYNEPSYDYKVAQAKYDNAKANGTLSKSQQITQADSVNKAKVGSNFSKDVRDYYGMSKSEVYNLITTDPNGKKIASDLLAYGDALQQAGIENNKYRTLKTGAEAFKPKTTVGQTSTASSRQASQMALLKAFKTPYSDLVKSQSKGAQLARSAKLGKKRA